MSAFGFLCIVFAAVLLFGLAAVRAFAIAIAAIGAVAFMLLLLFSGVHRITKPVQVQHEEPACGGWIDAKGVCTMTYEQFMGKAPPGPPPAVPAASSAAPAPPMEPPAIRQRATPPTVAPVPIPPPGRITPDFRPSSRT